MSDQSKREKYKKTNEEFVEKGSVESKKTNESEPEQPNYEEWTLEDLHKEAGRKDVKNHMGMDREELINRLKSR